MLWSGFVIYESDICFNGQYWLWASLADQVLSMYVVEV
jgi:hypothetical protein